MIRRVLFLCSLVAALIAAQELFAIPASRQSPAVGEMAPRHDPRARAILEKARLRMQRHPSLVADYGGSDAAGNFRREGEIFLERPNRFRIEEIEGVVTERRQLVAVSDGKSVVSVRGREFVAYTQAVRRENFFLGQNFLVQFFFDPRGIVFDPTYEIWGRAISVFDTNLAAYDKSTQLTHLGSRVMEGKRYEVVEIAYDARHSLISQQIFVGDDGFVHRVDTFASGTIASQRFENFRPGAALEEGTWDKTLPERMPIVFVNPVRMGVAAPQFAMQDVKGSEHTLQQLLRGKKALYICTLNGSAAKVGNADYHLAQMRILQQIKDKFARQGLAVVAIVGGSEITPDLRGEMLLNWMPDIDWFDYPVLLDFNVERGIQGDTYPSFLLNGRNNLLLDADGRVIFAAQNFDNRVNQFAFYQALAQIGFVISPADLDGVGR